MYKRFYPPTEHTLPQKSEEENLFPKKFPPISLDMTTHDSPDEKPRENKFLGLFKPDDLIIIGLLLVLLGEGIDDDETLIGVLALIFLGL